MSSKGRHGWKENIIVSYCWKIQVIIFSKYINTYRNCSKMRPPQYTPMWIYSHKFVEQILKICNCLCSYLSYHCVDFKPRSQGFIPMSGHERGKKPCSHVGWLFSYHVWYSFFRYNICFRKTAFEYKPTRLYTYFGTITVYLKKSLFK